eukprot:scaffold53685_cov44-Phaeocystis_antarctica.AAC.1
MAPDQPREKQATFYKVGQPENQVFTVFRSSWARCASAAARVAAASAAPTCPSCSRCDALRCDTRRAAGTAAAFLFAAAFPSAASFLFAAAFPSAAAFLSCSGDRATHSAASSAVANLP